MLNRIASEKSIIKNWWNIKNKIKKTRTVGSKRGKKEKGKLIRSIKTQKLRGIKTKMCLYWTINHQI